MRSASVSLTATTLVLVAVGLFPCLGWVGWIGSLVAAIAIIAGIVGLMTDKEGQNWPHIAAIAVGVLGGGVGALRCMLGGGIF